LWPGFVIIEALEPVFGMFPEELLKARQQLAFIQPPIRAQVLSGFLGRLQIQVLYVR